MQQREVQALDAAKLYYGLGKSQDEVARTLGVSRPTVSKLIQYAKECGFVSIDIHDPREDTSRLAQQLKERFGLADVRIAMAPDDHELILEEIGRIGAALLRDLIRDREIVGLSWGETLFSVGRHLTPVARTGVQIVELKGGVPYHSRRTREYETMPLFCDAFDACPRSLHLPLFFEHAATRRAVEKEPQIRAVLDLGREATTAIFTVGGIGPDATMFTLDSFASADRDYLLHRAVGDICSRFYDADGHICLPSLDQRTVAIALEDLASKERTVCIAGGRSKALPLAVALRAGYITHLVTDLGAARGVLEIDASRTT
ncbi:sugar-binding transcriptional regulator [Devriesea agamarum]|uniref:sugar-binding transcriptional regulator n=1 Tax=Devriesea agamarum TaxID=472569 RepID=UPI00071E062C|nr:sugar-binding transcriptional regulator [Devriesea agamarum]